jgi:hypothetical protein
MFWAICLELAQFKTNHDRVQFEPAFALETGMVYQPFTSKSNMGMGRICDRYLSACHCTPPGPSRQLNF